MINLTIDGKELSASEGATILETARDNGIYIPTLCYLPKLSWLKSCRLCIVDVEGIEKPVPSCATLVAEGMVVHTFTDRLEKMRRDTLKFMLIQHPIDCPVCDKGGECELQNLIYQYGISGQEHVSETVQRPDVPFGTPLIRQWMDRCVMCMRCIQACREVPGCNVLDVAERGLESHVEAVNPEACISCGECLHVCPVGALTDNVSKTKGRVWQTKRVKTTCMFCGCGCQLELNVLHNNKIIGVTSCDGEGINDGSLCVKGRFGYDYIHHPDRLTQPLLRRGDSLEEASWDEALKTIVTKLKGLKEEFGGDSIGAIGPSRGTNEEIYLLQKFMRLVMGSNRVDSGARLTAGATLAGLSQSLGYGAMTHNFESIARAELIIVVGADPDKDNLIFSHKIRQAILKNNARLILVDPRQNAMEKYANIWLRPYPGSDVAWINGLIKKLIDERAFDGGSGKTKIKGFSQLKKSVSSYSPERVEKLTGLSPDDLERVAELWSDAKSIAIAYGSGITQHTTGTNNVIALANLALVSHSLRDENGGLFPLMPQANGQGAFDAGGLSEFLPGYQRIDAPAVRHKFEQAWGGEIAAQPGGTLHSIIDDIYSRKVKGLIVFGENPLLTLPNPKRIETALRRLDLLVVMDVFVTETAQLADVVLPGATFAEKNGTFTNMERRIQRVRQAIAPLGGKAEWEVLSELAGRMGKIMAYEDPAEIMSEMASVSPIYRGICFERLENGGIQWPCAELDNAGTPLLYRGGFPEGGGRFIPVDFEEPEESPNDEFPLWLSIGGLNYNYAIGTREKRAAGLSRWYRETSVEIHPEDAKELGISTGEKVRLSTPRGHVEILARISEGVLRGMVYVAPEFCDVDVAGLAYAGFDSVGGTPQYKACAAKVERL